MHVLPADEDEIEEGDFLGEAPPPEPTAHGPGTEGKLRVLTDRATLGQALFGRDADEPDPRLDIRLSDEEPCMYQPGRTWGRTATLRRARRMLYDESNRG
jgi:hypothetical protein